MNGNRDILDAFNAAERGIQGYLQSKKDRGEIAEDYFRAALKNVFPNLRSWFLDEGGELDRLSPLLREGIRKAIESEDWDGLVNAYRGKVKFGTGGIRALMAFDEKSIIALRDVGLDAPILKGPNTINNIVVMQAAYGVARYLVELYQARRKSGGPSPSVVVGFDSRIRGDSFARLVAETFLAEGLNVFLFDEAVPYPEVTFAIPHLEADMGVFISASHNDYRYNGFKISDANGAQIKPEDRSKIIGFIEGCRIADLSPARLESATGEVLKKLTFLGGSTPLPGVEYLGRDLVDVHSVHIRHIMSFVLRKNPDGTVRGGDRLEIVYAAFNGSGRRAVPRILDQVGCKRLYRITALDRLDGLFPAFSREPQKEQQPDPGDPRAAHIAMKLLDNERGSADYVAWGDADLLIGTDPDADRCGVIVRPPAEYAAMLRNPPDEYRKAMAHDKSPRATPDFMLVPADDMWTLVVWYRLTHLKNTDRKREFIALSHTTSDMIVRLAEKFRVGVMKTWVGFGWLSNGVSQAWASPQLPVFVEGRASASDEYCNLVFHDTSKFGSGRDFNIATMEQSNGFSILGGPPADPARMMGTEGHVRDKDGTFAALLVSEIAAFAKETGTDVLSLLADHIYTDPDVGLFVNYYEPDPLDGEYPGIAGDSKKKNILDLAEAMCNKTLRGESVRLGRRTVRRVEKYRTGKYDGANWKGFPDEGLRYFFDSDYDYLTIRPSGTTNSLRFHLQLYAGAVGRQEVWKRRMELEAEATMMITELRERLGAPRD